MESIASQIKGIGSYNVLAADPLFGNHARALGPLLANVSNKPRQTVATLGKGTYGRVNLESTNVGNVATKYSLVDEYEDSDDLINELAALRYLRGLPNVAQLVGVGAPTVDQPFPAPMLAKAKDILAYSHDLYTSWDDVYSVVRQVLLGYYVLHERGIVHRDTKPWNMLITDIGEVQITDFGAAKYITQVPPNDKYTGTIIFASPELLMRSSYHRVVGSNQPVNWFAHDVWAVGMSLYHIITDELMLPIAVGRDAETALTAMFTTLGTPTRDDGETYALYNDYKTYVDHTLAATPKKSVKDLIIANAKLKPDDPAVLDQIASMIESMLNFDPAKRPTMKELLEQPIMSPYGGPPDIGPRPALTPGDYVLPTAPTERTEISAPMYEILSKWLYDVMKPKMKLDSITQQMIIFDRTLIYIYKIVEAAEKIAHPALTKRRNLQAIGSIALYISSNLFEDDPYKMQKFNVMSARAYSTPELFKLFRQILTLDIQYYGKTVYDELLELEADPAMHWKLGYLNMISYQANFYKTYPIEGVKRLMLEHARAMTGDPATILSSDTARANPFIYAVLALAHAPAGGVAPAGGAGAGAVARGGAVRKRAHKSRRTKRSNRKTRRGNTTRR